MCWFGSPDLCCDKWACKKPTDFLDESAQFQELREDDNSASEITYGEVEQRLGQLQEHLNRYVFLDSVHTKVTHEGSPSFDLTMNLPRRNE